MYQKVTLVGNLGKDPEIRNTQNGKKVASFSVATSEKFKDKNGERQTMTEWHNVVFFGTTAEVIEKYLHKGSKVMINGKCWIVQAIIKAIRIITVLELVIHHKTLGATPPKI